MKIRSKKIAGKAKSPEWRERERLVAMLERALTPDARVEHDQKLSVLGSKRRRQCDVVIRFGKSPRETLAIVEVQKRGRRPELTTFHGWVQKMRDVGAQSLFCVSELGYPSSIIEEVATKLGPTVRLLTLKNLEKGIQRNPLKLFPYFTATKPKFQTKSIAAFNCVPKLTGEGIGLSDSVFFRIPGDPVQSIEDIVGSLLNHEISAQVPPPHELENWRREVDVDVKGPGDLYFLLEGVQHSVIELKLCVEIFVECTHTPIEIDELVYEQQSIKGELAWVTKTVVNIGSTPFQFIAIVRKDADGFLTNTSITTTRVDAEKMSVRA